MIDRKIQVNSAHYDSKGYDNLERMQSYLEQIRIIISLNPAQLLEIGTGNGFVSSYLKKKGFNVTTCDIDEKLNPDKAGSVLALPFSDSSFDLVVCFQVLEHLPFSDVTKALSEISRVTKQLAIISLPDFERCYKFYLGKNSSNYFKKYLVIPRRIKPEHKFDGEHYWEIGKRGFSLQEVIKEIEKSNLGIIRTYRIFGNAYHRIFVLSKESLGVKTRKIKGMRLGSLENWRNEYLEENFSVNLFLKYFKTLLKR